MVGSIDPRCETVRGTHWPNKGRVVVWSSRRGNHLGQRFKATASTGRTYGCKRSDQTRKTLAARGPSTYGSLLSQGRRGAFFLVLRRASKIATQWLPGSFWSSQPCRPRSCLPTPTKSPIAPRRPRRLKKTRG